MTGSTGQAAALAADAGSVSSSIPTATMKTTVMAHMAHVSSAGDHAIALTRDDSAQPPALPVSLPTRTVSATPGRGQLPWVVLMVLAIPAALAMGLRRRKVQERSHVTTQP
jgi:hypothetical protein